MIYNLIQRVILSRYSNKQYIIKKILPFNSQIFTQGIIKCNNEFVVSSGHYNKSYIAKIDLDTGEIYQLKKLEKNYFGEGIAFNNKYIIQLTWKENIALCMDPITFDIKETFNYDGEGWGICYDNKCLFISDGSNVIRKLDNQTYHCIERLFITYKGKKIIGLNDLEYYDNYIYANIWNMDYILKINSRTGVVQTAYDFKNLTSYLKKKSKNIGVLNGITVIGENLFLITGKNWSNAFIVEFE